MKPLAGCPAWHPCPVNLGCFYYLGGSAPAPPSPGSCLMGRPNCFVFPSHRFCPSSLTERI